MVLCETYTTLPTMISTDFISTSTQNKLHNEITNAVLTHNIQSIYIDHLRFVLSKVVDNAYETGFESTLLTDRYISSDTCEKLSFEILKAVRQGLVHSSFVNHLMFIFEKVAEDAFNRGKETYLSFSQQSVVDMEYDVQDIEVEDPVTCSICLDDVESGHGIRTQCNHHFHQICLNTWSDRNNTCPNCRTELT